MKNVFRYLGHILKGIKYNNYIVLTVYIKIYNLTSLAIVEKINQVCKYKCKKNYLKNIFPDFRKTKYFTAEKANKLFLHNTSIT